MTAVAAALALAAVSFHWPSMPSVPFLKGSGVEHVRPAKGWDLRVATDRFTGEKMCRLDARYVRYEHGVVTFQFSHRTDTANAQFRIGDGPARSVGEVAVEAAGKGASFLTGNGRNPSDGAVRIPASQISADLVTIRPNRKAQPKTFRMTGFQQALAAARQRGCA